MVLIRASQATFYQITTTFNMAKALSKSQIAATVAEKHGITKRQAAEILDHLAELSYKNAKNTFTLGDV